MIEDCAYEGEDFRDDPELILPEWWEWDDRGKQDTIHHVFNFSSLFCNNEISENGFYTYIGSVRPAGMLPILRQERTREMVSYRSDAEEDLGYLEENLQRLTVGILDVTTNDLHRRYQCQKEGVFGRFSRLLCRVA